MLDTLRTFCDRHVALVVVTGAFIVTEMGYLAGESLRYVGALLL